MNHERFNEIVDAQIEHMKASLGYKSAEYATDTDKLHNFKAAGRIANEHPVKALDGMVLKHYTSYRDWVENINQGGKPPSIELLNERIGDIINYMVLFKALIIEMKDNEDIDKTIIDRINATYSHKVPY